MEPIKDAFHRLLRFGHAAKERAVPVWKSAQLRSEPALQWLKLRPRVVFWASGIGIALAFLVFSGATAAGAALLAWAALRQAQTASERHQEQTNADRQRRITESFSKAVEQLGSDKLEVRLGGIYSLERISKESPDDYWTVMENLTAFVRERSRRNEAERTSQDLEQRVSRRAYFLWLEAGRPDGRAEDFWADAAKQEEFGEPATDIAAVLTVIKRRSEQSREREGANDWRFDLSGADFETMSTSPDAHLERANLTVAHLEGADLRARISRGPTSLARISRGPTSVARISRGPTSGARISRGPTSATRISRGPTSWARISRGPTSPARISRGPTSTCAHLEGAYLWRASRGGLPPRRASRGGRPPWRASRGGRLQRCASRGGRPPRCSGLSRPLLLANGDAATKLPEGVGRPAHWPVEVT